MKLVRYNPFNELGFWNTSFDRFFNDSFSDSTRKNLWSPAVDIIDSKDDVVLKAELPGMKKDDIKVNIEDRVLTISGERTFEKEEEKDTFYRKERSYGSFKRSFTLSDNLLIDDIEADYTDGILSITLKKDVEKEAVKQITIN